MRYSTKTQILTPTRLAAALAAAGLMASAPALADQARSAQQEREPVGAATTATGQLPTDQRQLHRPGGPEISSHETAAQAREAGQETPRDGREPVGAATTPVAGQLPTDQRQLQREGGPPLRGELRGQQEQVMEAAADRQAQQQPAREPVGAARTMHGQLPTDQRQLHREGGPDIGSRQTGEARVERDAQREQRAEQRVGEQRWGQHGTAAQAQWQADQQHDRIRSEDLTNQQVLQMQRELNRLGYQAGPEDGLFGEQTASAMRHFQRDRGITAGPVTQQTLAALNVQLTQQQTADLGVQPATAGMQQQRDAAPGTLPAAGTGTAPVGAGVGTGAGAAAGTQPGAGVGTQRGVGADTRSGVGVGTAQPGTQPGPGAAQPALGMQHQMQHDEQTIRQAQRQLQQMGHYDGQIDGIKGPRTEAALRQYQQQRNLPQTGRLDSQTMQSLGVQAGTGTQPAAGMQQRGQIGAGTQPAAGTAASGVETTVDHDGTRVVPGGGDVDPGPRTVTGSGAQR